MRRCVQAPEGCAQRAAGERSGVARAVPGPGPPKFGGLSRGKAPLPPRQACGLPLAILGHAPRSQHRENRLLRASSQLEWAREEAS